MGETLSLFRFSFNKSRRIESRPERLTGKPGAVVLREIMARTRFIEWMVDRLHDPRKGDRVLQADWDPTFPKHVCEKSAISENPALRETLVKCPIGAR